MTCKGRHMPYQRGSTKRTQNSSSCLEALVKALRRSTLAGRQSKAATGRQKYAAPCGMVSSVRKARKGHQMASEGRRREERQRSLVLPGKAIVGVLRRVLEATYSKSPGLVRPSSTSAGVSGVRSSIGVRGGRADSFGGWFACRSLRMGCSSQFMRRALKGGKLW